MTNPDPARSAVITIAEVADDEHLREAAAPEPIPAETHEYDMSPEVQVTVVMIGGRALQMLVTTQEAASLQAIAEVSGINRRAYVTVQDAATMQQYTLSGDMIAAVGVPAARATWQLLVDATEREMYVIADLDGWPRPARVYPTSVEGFQLMVAFEGMASRPPAWMREASTDLTAASIHHQLMRL